MPATRRELEKRVEALEAETKALRKKTIVRPGKPTDPVRSLLPHSLAQDILGEGVHDYGWREVHTSEAVNTGLGLFVTAVDQFYTVSGACVAKGGNTGYDIVDIIPEHFGVEALEDLEARMTVTVYTNATSPAITVEWKLAEVHTAAGAAGNIDFTAAAVAASAVSQALTANNEHYLVTDFDLPTVSSPKRQYLLMARNLSGASQAGNSSINHIAKLYVRRKV